MQRNNELLCLTNNRTSSRSKKVTQNCERCSALPLEHIVAYTCCNGHWVCNICIEFVTKIGENNVCPRCKSTLLKGCNVCKKHVKNGEKDENILFSNNNNDCCESYYSRNEMESVKSGCMNNKCNNNILHKESLHCNGDNNSNGITTKILNGFVKKSRSNTDTTNLSSSKSKCCINIGNNNTDEKKSQGDTKVKELLGAPSRRSITSNNNNNSNCVICEKITCDCLFQKLQNPLMFNHNAYRKYVVPARPVVCPITMCSKIVAATGFIPHYEFEHQEVSIIEVATKEQYTLIVNPEQVINEHVGCICLFTLTTLGRPKYLSSLPKVHVDSLKEEPATRKILVPFTMMVARLLIKFGCESEVFYNGSNCNKNNNNNNYYYEEGVCLQQSSNGTIRMKAQNDKGKSNNQLMEDLGFLVLWICGFDSVPEVYYSLEATYNNYRTRACIYSGPVTSLREPQNPRELFKKGECLILSPGLTTSLIEDTGSLNINVIFH